MNLYEKANEAWETSEASRLKTMDELFGSVTTTDLSPVLAGQQLQVRNPIMADIGAGTGTASEELCGMFGVDYYALDVNAELLKQRSTREGRKVNADNTRLPFHDNAFDVTFTRAVTGWSREPEKVIAEQLRVTRAGGVAIFSEFDWTGSGAISGSGAIESIMEAKTIIARVLRMSGFEPTYGSRLAQDIDQVICQNNIAGERHEERHELPIANYAPFLIHSIDTILSQLQHPRGETAVIATSLQSCREAIVDNPNVRFKLPALMTQTVRLAV